jgi:hypothetical protein
MRKKSKRSRRRARATARTRRRSDRWRTWLGGGVSTGVIAGVILALVLSAGHKVVAEVAGSPQPLTITTHLFPPSESCQGGAGWVFPQQSNELPVPSWQASDPSLQRWASDYHGIPASGNFVVVDLQALPGHTVIVNDIRVHVVSRAPAPDGTYPELSGGCGGIVPTSFKANLDGSAIVLTRTSEGGGVGKPAPPIPLPHAVSESSPEVWYINSVTRTCDCQWTVTLDWSADGKTGTSTIEDAGKPFRTAATTHAARVIRDVSGKAWETF